MHVNPLVPLSKDRLFNWLKTLSNQLSKGALIIDTHDVNFSILHANNDFLTFSNYNLEQLIGQNVTIFNGPKTDLETVNELIYHIKQGITQKFTILHYTADGSAFWNYISIDPFRDENQIIQYLLITCEDHTELELNKMLSKLEHEVYKEIDEDDNLQSILTLISNKIETYYIRDVYCTIHLFDESNHYRSFGSNTLPVDIIEQLDLLCLTPKKGANEAAIYLKNFTYTPVTEQIFKSQQLNLVSSSWTKPILDTQKNSIGILTLFHQNKTDLKQDDINYLNRMALLIHLAIKYAEQKYELLRLAFYDVETNLPNAHFFKTELHQWIKDGFEGFIALLHPKEFNKIVDLYGRSAGDNLLRQMVNRLKEQATPSEEFVARFSNSIIIAKKTGTRNLERYQSHIKRLTTMPYFINDKENYITVKIGISFFHSQSHVDECLHQADIALSKSQSINGTNVALYEENSNKQLAEEMEIFNQLIYGISNEEFKVHLQPKINMGTLEIEGFEALSRWHSHTLGHVSPAQFIPVAEQSGKIKHIDLQNFKTILSWLQNRIHLGKPILPIALNISPDHFYDPKFLKNVELIFKQYDVPANYIQFEVTESIELVDFIKAKDILNQLNELGIKSSIDDFGVGFSSLSYLPKLPFSEIKIDRSFINSMCDPGVYAVVQTIIQLANNIQMRAIAEGIETKEQLTMLQEMGCPAGQGFYFFKPMSLADAEKLLDA